MTIQLGFYIVNTTRCTYAAWYDTDTLPPFDELPEAFASKNDHIQLVLITQDDHSYFGLPYRSTNIQMLAESEPTIRKAEWALKPELRLNDGIRFEYVGQDGIVEERRHAR